VKRAPAEARAVSFGPEFVASLKTAGLKDRRELLGRLTLWNEAVITTADLLDIAVRMRAYAEKSHKGVDPFPSTHDAYQIADHLPLLSAVVFSTIFNVGRQASDSVSANSGRLVSTLRGSIESVAFPDRAALNRYRKLQHRLQKGRNGMIAHVDGSAFNLTHRRELTTLWPITAAVTWEDVEPWREMVRALRQSIWAHQGLLREGVFEEAGTEHPIFSELPRR